jgi:hypothetical protein
MDPLADDLSLRDATAGRDLLDQGQIRRISVNVSALQ